MKLIGGDFSNIEGRVNAWFAGEQWKLDAFRAYDAHTGPDLYILNVAKMYGLDPASVKKEDPRRQLGKVGELACGYQGSVGAYVNMAANYLLHPGEVARVAKASVTDDEWGRATHDLTRHRERHGAMYGLEPEVWIGVKTVVNGWRDSNPAIVSSWWEVQDAAVEAVANPGMVVPALSGRIAYQMQGANLFCRLPTGRVLAYMSAHIRWTPTGDFRDTGRVKVQSDPGFDDIVTPVKEPVRKRTVHYIGVDDKKRWTLQTLYGGKQCNHYTQGTARDLLTRAMLRLEAAKYPCVLTVHDEVLAEVADAFGSADQFADIMAELPPEFAGLPVSVSAWEGQRYEK